MAIVGSAYVEIHAVTSKVAGQIRNALRDGMKGVGRRAGEQFGREFGIAAGASIDRELQKTTTRTTNTFGRAGTAAGRAFRTNFLAAVGDIKQHLDKTKITFKTDLDTRGAIAKANVFAARAGKTITFNANLNTQTAQVQAPVAARRMRQDVPFTVTLRRRSVSQALISVAALAQSFKTIIIPAAVIGAAPYILSLAASFVQAAGAANLLPAALAAVALAVGTLLVGFSGVKTAISALSKEDKNSAASAVAAAKQRIAAARSIASAQESVSNAIRQADRTAVQGAEAVSDARRRVADAEESAAQRIESARVAIARAYEAADLRMESAERSLGDAQRAVLRDQEAINEARETARERIEDLALSLRDAALDEEEAQLRLRDAQRELAEATMKGVQGDALLEYDLAVRRAQLSVDKAVESHVDLKNESEEAARTGVEGSREIVDAQDRAAESAQRLLEVEQEVARTRVENARDIADAEAEYVQTRKDGMRDVADAQLQLDRTIVQSNQSNEDSARAVADAYRSLDQAIADAADAGSEGVSKSAEAMARLSPAARDLVTAIWGLKPAWDAARLDVQERMLTGIGSRVTELGQNYIPILNGALGFVADGFNRAFRSSLDFFNTAVTTADMKYALDNTALGINNASNAIQPLLQAFRDLFVVGSTFLPGFGTSLTNISQRFADFIARARESGQLAVWIQRGIDALTQMWHVIQNVSSILKSLFDIAQSSGEPFLSILERVTAAGAAFFKTPEGQAAWHDFFMNARLGVESFIEKLRIAWPVIKAAGSALFDVVNSAQPLLNVVSSLVAFALEPLLRVLQFLAPVIGPLIAIIATVSLGMRLWAGAVAFARVAMLAYNIAVGAQTIVTTAAAAALRAHSIAAAAGTVAGYAARAAILVWTVAQRGLTAATVAWNAVVRIANAYCRLFTGLTVAQTAAQIRSTIATKAAAVASKVMAAGQWLLNAALSANPIGLVVIAIAALVAAFVIAWKHSETFRNIVIGAWHGIQDAASAVWNGFLKPIFDAIGAAIDWVIEHWRLFATVLLIAMGPVGIIIGAFTIFHDQIIGIFTAIGNFFEDKWNEIDAYFHAKLAEFNSWWSGVWGGIKDRFWAIVYGIRDAGVNAWNALQSFYNTKIAEFSNWWDNTWRGIKDRFWSIVNGIRDAGVNAWDSFWSYYHTKVTEFENWWNGVWGGIKDGFGRAFGGIVDIGRNILNDLKRQFTDGLNAIIGGLNWPIEKINGLFSISIPTIPKVNLASGGDVAGRVSGLPGRRADRVPAALSTEEHVWSAGEVDRAGGHAGVRRLRAMARAGLLDGLAGGGLVTSRDTPDLEKGAFVVEPKIVDISKRFLAALNAGQPEAVQATGGRFAKMSGFAVGGSLLVPGLQDGGAIENAVRVLRSMNRKPYIWGGEGTAGTDCSGIQAYATRALRMEPNPYRRIGTTATFPWPGFLPGLKSAYAIGNVPGSHMRGNLAGVNIEAGGSHGYVAYGPPAQGVPYGSNYHLPSAGGTFAPGGGQGSDPGRIFDSIAGFVKNETRDLIRKVVPDVPVMFEPMALGIFDKSWDGMRKKAVDAISFDNGGWLPRGMSLAMNRTGRSEAVVPGRTLNGIEKLITISQQTIEKIRDSDSDDTRRTFTIQDGAFQVVINGTPDAVTIADLKKTLRDWGNEILHELEGRR